MNMIFRFIWVIWRGLRLARNNPAPDPLGAFEIPMVVLPNDLDLNIHMNNGRFLSIMDLGRMDLMARLGVMRRALRERWTPIVGAAAIRYRKPLAPFQHYTLSTRIIGWDKKWAYIAQRFESRDKIVAHAVVQVTILKDGARIPTHDLLAIAGYDGPDVAPPDWARALVAAEPVVNGPDQAAA